MRTSLRFLAPAILLPALLTASPGSAQAATAKWPGDPAVTVADSAGFFGENLSGLSFEGPDVLWAVKNGPGTLYRLTRTGGTWAPASGWPSGKELHYRGGDPDAEGVVATPDGVFAATERDNDEDGSVLKVLRFDTGSSSASLSAVAEWELTGDLPDVDDNGGFEGITWVPDAFLTAGGFRDDHTKAPYDPATYAGHGTGLYFAGLEDEGKIYAYALDQAGGGFTRVATIASGFPKVMELEFDPATAASGRSATTRATASRRS